MPCTCQAFSLFATGIVSPRVALFRKYNPTCTAEADDVNVGLVITLAILAAVALLLVALPFPVMNQPGALTAIRNVPPAQTRPSGQS